MSSYGNQSGRSYSSYKLQGYGDSSASSSNRRERGNDYSSGQGIRGHDYAARQGRGEDEYGRQQQQRGGGSGRSYGDSRGGSYGNGSSAWDKNSASLPNPTISDPDGGRGASAGIRGYAAASREGRSQYTDRSQPSRRYQPKGYSDYPGDGSYQTNDVDDEEDEIGIIKAKIQDVKKESVASSRRALEHAERATQQGADTLVLLGQQTEQLHNIERTLELTSIEAENSVEKSSKLRTLNKSIFHIHMNMPFTGKKRRMQEQMKLEAEQERVRMANDRKNAQVHESRRRVNQSAGDGPRYNGPEGVMSANGEIISSRNPRDMSRSERSRYTFEDEDPELENEINSNLDQLSEYTRRLKELSLATKAELEAQDDPMKRIGEVADKTHDTVGIANFHLSKIK
ncbi:Protein transport protein S9 plasma membrane t-SNARE [Coemansia sp. BCRC 34490]|nr:Protein transport protein S9 plasma membrane t-SNARE [Coemansia sp. BCRC 34490]